MRLMLRLSSVRKKAKYRECNMGIVDSVIIGNLNALIERIEDLFDSDAVSVYGSLDQRIENPFFSTVDDLVGNGKKNGNLTVILTTYGGSAETVDRLVKIVRHHYKNVNFIIPDYAYSAGTIFCMSGNNIYMDYYSILGPIDPQVKNRDGKWLPALGYLDKINELIKKANLNTISKPEFLMLKEFDLAELRSYEQAKEFAISLLREWLATYKFENWNVANEQKVLRADEIANALSDNSLWLSHGRPIDIHQLRKLQLKIEDFGEDKDKSSAIRTYYALLADYTNKYGLTMTIHTKGVFVQ